MNTPVAISRVQEPTVAVTSRGALRRAGTNLRMGTLWSIRFVRAALRWLFRGVDGEGYFKSKYEPNHNDMPGFILVALLPLAIPAAFVWAIGWTVSTAYGKVMDFLGDND
jgi:hypothetical protein